MQSYYNKKRQTKNVHLKYLKSMKIELAYFCTKHFIQNAFIQKIKNYILIKTLFNLTEQVKRDYVRKSKVSPIFAK